MEEQLSLEGVKSLVQCGLHHLYFEQFDSLVEAIMFDMRRMSALLVFFENGRCLLVLTLTH
jgi:hypothetical protein